MVILLHGYGSCAYVFHETMAPLAAAGYRVIAPELRGHGLSQGPVRSGDYTTPALARHVIEIMDALGVECATLLGHSMGAGVALEIARSWPARAAGVVAAAPVALATEWAGVMGRWLFPPLPSALVARFAPRWVFTWILKAASGRNGFPRPRDVDAFHAQSQFPGYVWAARRSLIEFGWRAWPRARLAEIQCPVLVLLGTKDRLVSRRSVMRSLSAMDTWEFVPIEGAGHFLLPEAPGEIARAVVGFLSRIGEKAGGADDR